MRAGATVVDALGELPSAVVEILTRTKGQSPFDPVTLGDKSRAGIAGIPTKSGLSCSVDVARADVRGENDIALDIESHRQIAFHHRRVHRPAENRR